MIFIPSVKATTSGSNITKVEVKWYLRNSSSGSYEEITDSTLLDQIQNLAIELTQYTGSTVEERKAEGFTVGDYSFSPSENTWAFPADASGSAKQANSIAVGFDMNGVSYRFEFRQS